MSLIARLLAAPRSDGALVDLRIGTHWTMAVFETAEGRRGGLAATQTTPDLEHGRPAVREVGGLLGRSAGEIVGLATSESLTERSIGFAALNALLNFDPAACIEQNAEALIVAHGRGRNVAIVGHFPFVPRVREIAGQTWVLELRPGPEDLPAVLAPELLPQADVVALTGMSLVNGTFEALAALCRPDAFVVLLGGSTPLTPLFFDYGVDAVSGTLIVDIPAGLAAVSQAANFRQIPGKRLLTLVRGAV